MFGGFNFGGGAHQQPEQAKEVDTTQLYTVLQLSKTATTQEIKKAYRRGAMKYHPDKKGGDPEKFRSISQAHQILSNPQKRELYDQYGMDGVKNGGPSNQEGFSFGPNVNKGPKKQKPKLIIVPISLKKAYEGGMHQVEVTRMRICVKCDGKGGQNSKTCPKCKGQRVVQKLVMLGPGMYTQTAAACEQCQAEGVIFQQKDRCTVCLGKRIVQQKKVIDVVIEPGVPHEHDYIMTGQADQYPGILAGDLYFRMNIQQSPDFKRRGADLLHKKEITLLQALTRVTFQLTLLDGSNIIISTSPNQVISNGDKKVIKHKGMPFYKDPFSKGNLIVEFHIIFPKSGEILEANYTRLAQILGQKLNNPEAQKEQQLIYLQEYKEPLHKNKQQQQWQDQEQDEEGGHQGQKVACNQQ